MEEIRREKDLFYLIGLDLGTSALKGVLMDERGTVVHEAERRVDYSRPLPGYVELDAGRHERDVTDILRELAAASPGVVRAVAFSAASGNTLLADQNGRPLTPIINWMDTRCVADPPSVLSTLRVEEVRRITGWPCIDSFPLAHLAWLRTHHPELLDRADQVCMNTDWLLYQLTGQRLMDHSTATTSHLQNQIDRCWHRPYLELLGISEDRLAGLTGPGVLAGELTREAASRSGLTTQTAMVTGCFDHPSAARALGVLEPGELLLSCGTSWVGFLPHDDRNALLDAGLLCDPFLTLSGGPWGGLFSIPRVGQNIDWYVENLIAVGETDRYRVFNKLAAQAEPGAGGLAIDLRQPPKYISGDPAQIARAVMEGAAALLAEKIEGLKKLGCDFSHAVLAGGPSKSPVWPDIIARRLGIEIKVASPHAGAVGAAILAGIGAGIYKDERDALKKIGDDKNGQKMASAAGVWPRCTDRDREVYETELRGFLPSRIFDAHVHLFDAACRRPGSQFEPKSCYRRFGGRFLLEQYLGWAGEWLPEQEIFLNSFGSPSVETDLDLSAAYTGGISDRCRYFGMALISPHDTVEVLRRRVEDYGLIGLKPYPGFADWKPVGDVTIRDMLTEEQLRYADERRLAITLHIPRAGRLADPVNQEQMLWLCRTYPDIKVIYAHIGRAYYLKNVAGFLDRIAECPNAFIDTSMVNHEGVLEHAFRRFPRERILFGSDAPIAMLRGKSVEINNQYAYLMGEDYEIGTSIHDAGHAVEFTSFYYEQLRGIKLAAERAGLSRNEVECIFFHNAFGIFRGMVL